MVSSEAEKPPMLTSPLARPSDCDGVKERARSKATIEAGPPVAVVSTITTSSHSGAGVSRSSTAVQGTIIAATIPITSHER